MTPDEIYLYSDVFSPMRARYQPDGKVDCVKLLIAVSACLLVSALVAVCMAFLMYAGFYFIIVVPLLAALACATAAACAIGLAHCWSGRLGQARR